MLRERPVGVAGYDEFSFQPPRDLARGEEADDEAGSRGEGRLVADKLPLTTDRNGAASFTLKELPKITRPSELVAEVTFNDPNGEVQTVLDHRCAVAERGGAGHQAPAPGPARAARST